MIDRFMLSGANGSLTAYVDYLVRQLPFFPVIIACLMFLLAIVAWKERQLTAGGAFGAFVLGNLTTFAFGFGGLFLYVFFLLSASVLARIGSQNKTVASAQQTQKKGSCRDFMQVFANGGAGFFLALLYLYQPSMRLLLLFGASVAEAVSDTFAGEVGVLLGGPSFSVLTGRPMKKGLSGAVSRGGTLAGLIAAFFVAMLWYPCFFPVAAKSLVFLVIVAFAGFLGCVADSLLGATIQVQYYALDGSLTEKSQMDGKSLEKARGIAFFDNDIVNLCSNCIAVAIAYLLSIIFF